MRMTEAGEERLEFYRKDAAYRKKAPTVQAEPDRRTSRYLDLATKHQPGWFSVEKEPYRFLLIMEHLVEKGIRRHFQTYANKPQVADAITELVPCGNRLVEVWDLDKGLEVPVMVEVTLQMPGLCDPVDD